MTLYEKRPEESVDQWLERTTLEYLGPRSLGTPPEVYYQAVADTIKHARKLYELAAVKPR